MMKEKRVTQIGSLPYEDVSEALDYSLRHDIPFLPELTERREHMFEYILKPTDPKRLSCLGDFKKAVRGYEDVKIQSVGPATLILYGGYSPEDAVERISTHISNTMDGLDVGNVFLFLDEPAIGQFRSDFKFLWGQIFGKFGVTKGVHTCGDANWKEIFESDIDVVSFDSSRCDVDIGHRNEKRIAWGIKNKGDVKDFREGDLLTLPCGMSSPEYSVADCEKNLEMLLRVSKEIGLVRT
jgi:hypothetical protein